MLVLAKGEDNFLGEPLDAVNEFFNGDRVVFVGIVDEFLEFDVEEFLADAEDITEVVTDDAGSIFDANKINVFEISVDDVADMVGVDAALTLLFVIIVALDFRAEVVVTAGSGVVILAAVTIVFASVASSAIASALFSSFFSLFFLTELFLYLRKGVDTSFDGIRITTGVDVDVWVEALIDVDAIVKILVVEEDELIK